MGHRIVDELRSELGYGGRERGVRRERRAPRPMPPPAAGVPPPAAGVPPPAAPPPPAPVAPQIAAPQWPPPATSIPMPAQATFQNVQMPQVQLPGAYGTRPPEFAPPQPVPQSLPSLPQSIPPQANAPGAPPPAPPPVVPPQGPALGKAQPAQPPLQPQSLQGRLTGVQMQSAQDRIAAARAQAQARLAAIGQG